MTLRYAPIVFVIAGIGLVMWLSRQRMPHEWQSDVLEALSDTEALPPTAIRDRAPLAHQDLDLHTLESVLDALCTQGQAVRWYQPAADDGRPRPVYRRIAAPATDRPPSPF
jgi:hypothetical protein